MKNDHDLVFYRKFRPQKIAQLDLVHIRQELANILTSKNFPHAFLFSGPRGTGKTSSARILAKSINCLKRKGSEPCDECEMCVSISRGTNLDVLEIDAASNRGIDEIRDLREKIKLSPTSAQFKVYIIDEVHMLTQEAFNALLKTLEEPPAHAVFVLCTTEVHKLPETIISRCLRLDFKKGNSEEVLRSLERVVEDEKLEVEPEALKEIARRADGSFRDGQKILQQASAGVEKITLARVQEIFGQSASVSPKQILVALSEKDTPLAIKVISGVVSSGGNLGIYTENILETLREILLRKIGVEGEASSDLPQFELAELKNLIEIFTRAWVELKTSVIPQLPLEMAVVEWCEADSDDISVARGPVGLHPHPTSSVASLPAGARRGSPAPATTTPRSVNEESSSATPRSEKEEADLTHVLSSWPQILSAVKPYNHTLAGLLRSCRPTGFDGKILTIETAYQFHKDKVEKHELREILDKVLSEVLGKDVKVKCILKGGQ